MKTSKLPIFTAVLLAALLILPGHALAGTDVYLTGDEIAEPKLDAAEYPTKIEAERYGEGPATVLETSVGPISCETTNFSSFTQVKAPRDDFTLSSGEEAFSGCVFQAGESETAVHVTTNSCRLAYTGFEYVTGPNFTAAAEIKCSNEDEIEVGDSSNLCVIHIPAQEINHPTTLTNTYGEIEDLNIGTTGSGLTYDVQPGFCPLLGLEEGIHEDGGIGLDLLAQDVFMTGGSARIEAAEYPTEITGERYEEGGVTGKLDVIEAGEIKSSCEGVEADGGTLAQPAYSLNIDTTFSECTSDSWETPVDMNSCSYYIPEFRYLAGEGNYRYDPEIRCTSEGDAIEVGESLCTLSIHPQVLETEYINVAINKELGGQKDIAAAIVGEGLEYTSEPGFCGLLGVPEGDHDDGAMALYLLLK